MPNLTKVGRGMMGKYVGGMVAPTTLDNITNVANAAKSVFTAIGAGVGFGVLTAYTFKRAKDKIQNDTRRKSMLSNLMETDPIIGQADKQQVLEYYATIFHVAPKISLDKNAVRELLQAFIKFGRVDMATLKMLADTESKATSREFSPLALIGTL